MDSDNVMANEFTFICQTNEYFFHLKSIKTFHCIRKLSYEIYTTAVTVEVSQELTHRYTSVAHLKRYPLSQSSQPQTFQKGGQVVIRIWAKTEQKCLDPYTHFPRDHWSPDFQYNPLGVLLLRAVQSSTGNISLLTCSCIKRSILYNNHTLQGN